MRKYKKASDHMIARARELRQGSTRSERMLWSGLRSRRSAGLRFRRQQPLGRYVADFFCAAAKVVVELDGGSHDRRGPEDRERERYLEQQGLAVLRFPDEQVLVNPNEVVAEIVRVCKLRLQAHPLP